MTKISMIKTANSYAKAWLEAAKSDKVEDKALADAEALAQSFRDNYNDWDILSSPVMNDDVVFDILKKIASKCKLTKVSAEVLKLIVQNKRLNIAGDIFNEYIKLYYEDKGIVEVLVETAVPLSKIQHNKLLKVLEEKLNSSIMIKYDVNPNVLGGLAIRYNSFLFDDTLLNKINKIEKIMKGENIDL